MEFRRWAVVMSETTITEDNVVVLFKKFEDLQRDEAEITGEFMAEWERAYRKFDIVQAAINGDHVALAKFADPEVALAKSQVEGSIKTFGDTLVARVRSVATLASALKDAVSKRDGRLYGVTEVAKRSRRFAMAQDRRNYGPAAAVLPMERRDER